MTADIALRKEEISKIFMFISEDLKGSNAWRYQRQISGAIQEYIEALSFEHYLVRQTLIGPDEALGSIAGGIQLTQDDYLLGLFDLVGELMRFAITQMATRGFLPGQHNTDHGSGESQVAGRAPGGHRTRRDILTDLRLLRSYFESLNTNGNGALAREADKKMEVMKTSVEKVETAVYGIILRGRERPKGWVPTLTDEITGRHELAESCE